jgi:hypothetical protein
MDVTASTRSVVVSSCVGREDQISARRGVADVADTAFPGSRNMMSDLSRALTPGRAGARSNLAAYAAEF